jgi:hypothetical protein
MKKFLIICAVLAAGLGSCKKDYLNPNAPSDEQVFSSADGLTKVVVGLKQRFAVNGIGIATNYSMITCAGLSAGELTVLNAGNADLAQLQNGRSNLAPNNGTITSFWVTANVINSEASKVIASLDVVADQNYRNAVQIYAHLYKAMAIGSMAMFWEQVPIVNGPEAAYVSRTEALAEAIKLLDDASALLGTTTIPGAFLSQVGSEIDLRNTLLALSARYNGFLGNHDAAIARAAAVDLSRRSTFFYNTINPNPVFRSSLTTNNVYGVVANFGLPASLAPDPADKRIPFYLQRNAQNGSGFFRSDGGDSSQIPIYLPGEMLLIQAEAYARKNDLVNAQLYLDSVLTKRTDVFRVGADLPPYSGPSTQADLLLEIYRNRCIELYMSGMKLEDSRRFGRPGPTNTTGAERTRDFYPYPQQERDGNQQTPEDPAI